MADKTPNPKQVAELKPLIDAVQSAHFKKSAAEAAYSSASQALRMAVGDDHEFTNEMCRVNKIGGHIYSPGYSRGVGHRNCILCGVDDWDM
jgi:hypothetical protein